MDRAMRQGVLVDLDGTLVDTNYLHTLAWSRALADDGAWAPMYAIHHLIGMGSEQLVGRLVGGPRPGALEARKRRYGELIGEARVLPGAQAALRAWHDAGLVVVVATSSPKEELKVMLELLDADAVIDAVTSADDVDQAKPHPDVFSAALEAGGLDSLTAVVVGDSVWDIEAARRAGLPAVGVESGGIAAADLRAAGASDVVHDVTCVDVELLQATFEASPGRHVTSGSSRTVGET
jgi:HAD superfamily hydrolase (TIGR01509 family)